MSAALAYADDVEDIQIPWVQDKQKRLVTCPADEILYGGARGGGKSWGVMFDWLSHEQRYGKHSKGILFRKTYKDLEDFIIESYNVFPLFGGRWIKSSSTWEFESGAILRFRHLDSDKDAGNYIGHQYNWVCFEEAGLWANPNPLDLIKSSLRSPHGVPIRAIYTTNPGGPGHNWLKKRFVDPSPPMRIFQADINGIKVSRVFIPSTFDDNPALKDNDPTYMDRIVASGIPDWLIKAWRDGDWDITAGGMFDDLWRRDLHVIEPFKIPASWRVDRSFDWGSARPFSVGWWAESDGTVAPNGKHYPRGTLFRIKEWYGSTGNNQGLRLGAGEVARGIKERDNAITSQYGVPVNPGAADSAIFSSENGPSVGDDMMREGVYWLHADKKPGSRVAGWEQMRKRLKATGTEDPGLYVFNTCTESIAQIPTTQRDQKKPDDIDTNSEDHLQDEWRYRINTQGPAKQGQFNFA